MVCVLPQLPTTIDLTMIQPLSSSPKYNDFKSDRQLAKTLIADMPDGFWGCQFTALAQRIGELNKGDVAWWLARPLQNQALAEFLELPLKDLGVLAKSSSFVASFPDFPALKPLDLKREAPWLLGQWRKAVWRLDHSRKGK